ncbi:MAG: nickel-dependent lactate racemase [Pyrinomonadaceae bacterium]
MTTIELGYGANSIAFEYDEARFELLVPGEWPTGPLSDSEIGDAFENPIESPVLEDIVAAGDSVLIVVSDATRATASAQVVNLLVRRLIQAGVSPSDLAIIFATGIHRTPTDDEKRELLTPFIAQRIRTIQHNASDQSQLVRLGETERGTPIEVNRALKDHSHVILTGAVGFHYFAGFTGGRKSVCPGLASAQTIEATHMLALDFASGGRRAGVAAGQLEGNPVHEECERVTELIAPSFLINTVVDERGRARRVFAGNWRAAHRRACEEYARWHSQKIEQKRAVVVVSCGGSPYDINLIQAHKALDMAAHACIAGGLIVLLAECADGLGRADFLKWFECPDSRALEQRLCETYEVNGQTAWALLTKTEQFRVRIISKVADADVQRMRMIPARTLKEALADVPPGTIGYLMPRGAAVLPITIN